MRSMIGTALALVLAAKATALVPADQLAKPPADATEWTAPDGALMGRFHLVLRGQVWDEDEMVRVGSDGTIAAYELRGSDPSGDAAETFVSPVESSG